LLEAGINDIKEQKEQMSVVKQWFGVTHPLRIPAADFQAAQDFVEWAWTDRVGRASLPIAQISL
jgi:hypothetical protein